MRSRLWATKTVPVAVLAAVALLAPVASSRTKYSVLHDFGASDDGNVPSGPPVLGDGGNLYGVTGGGPGQYGNGVLFELTRQADGRWSEQVLYSFSGGSDGANPWGGLIFDGSGNLYGTTDGSPVTKSEVFELAHVSGGWNFSVLYDNGAGHGLLLDKAGNLYGSIGPGDYFAIGAIGELSPASNGWTYTQLYPFCNQYHCADGYEPVFPPIWDAHGHLLG